MAEIRCLKCKETFENCKCFIYKNIDENHSLPTLDGKDHKIPEIVEAKGGYESKSIENSDKLCSEFHQIHIENFENMNTQENENNKEVNQISDLNELNNFCSSSDEISTKGIVENQCGHLMSGSDYLKKVYSDEVLSLNVSAKNFEADYKSETEFQRNFERDPNLTSAFLQQSDDYNMISPSVFNWQFICESNPSTSTDQSRSEKCKMQDQRSNSYSLCSKENVTKYSFDAALLETHLANETVSETANISFDTNFLHMTEKSYRNVNENSEENLTDQLNVHGVDSQPALEKLNLVDELWEFIKSMEAESSVIEHSESKSDLSGSQKGSFDSSVTNRECNLQRNLANYVSNVCENKYNECEEAIFSQKFLKEHYVSQSTENLKVCGNSQNVLSCENQSEPHTSTDNIKDIYNQIYTSRTPFVCDRCKKRFVTKSGLAVHYRTHTGEKTYNCDVCKRRFILKSSFKYHYKTHTNEKPFVCDTKKSI